MRMVILICTDKQLQVSLRLSKKTQPSKRIYIYLEISLRILQFGWQESSQTLFANQTAKHLRKAFVDLNPILRRLVQLY